jgi:hypothetical protein
MTALPYSIGFVLHQPVPQQLVIIGLRDFTQPPDVGQLLLPNQNRLRYGLKPLPLGYLEHPTGDVGQGPMYVRDIEIRESSSSVCDIALPGSFLCSLEADVQVLEHSCIIHLATSSIVPFLSASWVKASTRSPGQRETLELFKNDSLRLNVCYPVEFRHSGHEIAVGIFRLHTDATNHGCSGKIHCLCDGATLLPPTVDLYRFQHFIGTATLANQKR